MDRLFKTNSAIDETIATTKRRSFFMVGLIFLIVYIIGSTASGVVLAVPMYVELFNDPEVSAAVEEYINDPAANMQGYMDAVTEASERIMASMPEWLNIVSLFATVTTIIATLIYCCKIEKRRLFTLGFVKKGAVTEYLSGLLIGLILFSAAYGIIILSGEAEFIGLNTEMSVGIIIAFFLGFMIQGASEEILLRSYFFVSGAANSNVVISVFVSSALFAMMHYSNLGISIMAIVNLFLFGVFAALYFLRRGSIWGICAIHSVWNFAQGNIFGCKVSGMEMGNSIFLTVENGSTLWSGGAFGPEGGIGVTIVLSIGIMILTFMKNKNINEFFVIKNTEFVSA